MPTQVPTLNPTDFPTVDPTFAPSCVPSMNPSIEPTGISFCLESFYEASYRTFPFQLIPILFNLPKEENVN